MARKEFTEEEIAILKTSPHVMDVSPAIIHFNAAFKELFWNKLQAGVDPATIFREAGIDPDMLGKTRVDGFMVSSVAASTAVEPEIRPALEFTTYWATSKTAMTMLKVLVISMTATKVLKIHLKKIQVSKFARLLCSMIS